MDEYDDSTPSPLRTALTVLLIVLVPLALGIFLAGRLLPRPQVGIVRLSYDIGSLSTYETVSYTHLDVYKRQGLGRP